MPKSTEKNYTWTNATSATATIVVSQTFIEKVWKQFVLLSYTLTFFPLWDSCYSRCEISYVT